MDSAYSNSRYPLWVFDIGELLRGAVWPAAVMRRATTRLHVRNIQHECSPRFPNLSREKDSPNGNVYIIGLK